MRILYKKNDDNVIIIRMFGNSPVVEVPASVAGLPVAGLSAYCFSEKESVSDDEVSEWESGDEGGEIRALSGDYITKVGLPGTIRSIGDLCFYGCRELKTIELYAGGTEGAVPGSNTDGHRVSTPDSPEGAVPGSDVDGPGESTPDSQEDRDLTIGSDAFMNCHKLKRFILHKRVSERTALRRILLQRTASTYVSFEDVAAYFPEYTEHYDLIGPAHIFELAIDGEGLRVRQCFEDEVFKPEMYDSMFKRAMTSEDEKTLCRMAASRLQYPANLAADVRQMYETYIGEHIGTLAADAVRDRDLSLIIDLAERGELTSGHIKQCLQLTTKERWLEGTRMLLGVHIDHE